MDARFEVVRKDHAISRPRLTVAKDRVTLKLSAGVSDYHAAHLEAFARKIAEAMLPNLDRTMRGSFQHDGNSISLYNIGRTTKSSFRTVDVGMEMVELKENA